MTVGKSEDVPTLHELAEKLTDLVTTADAFTDAPESTRTITEIVETAKAIRKEIDANAILVALDPKDIDALAQGIVPQWLATFTATVDETRSCTNEPVRSTVPETSGERIFTIIETADIEILGVHAYRSKQSADLAFDAISRENGVTDTDATGEVGGTLRIAGDDAFAIQLLEVPFG